MRLVELLAKQKAPQTHLEQSKQTSKQTFVGLMAECHFWVRDRHAHSARVSVQSVSMQKKAKMKVGGGREKLSIGCSSVGASWTRLAQVGKQINHATSLFVCLFVCLLFASLLFLSWPRQTIVFLWKFCYKAGSFIWMQVNHVDLSGKKRNSWRVYFNSKRNKAREVKRMKSGNGAVWDQTRRNKTKTKSSNEEQEHSTGRPTETSSQVATLKLSFNST